MAGKKQSAKSKTSATGKTKLPAEAAQYRTALLSDSYDDKKYDRAFLMKQLSAFIAAGDEEALNKFMLKEPQIAKDYIWSCIYQQKTELIPPCWKTEDVLKKLYIDQMEGSVCSCAPLFQAFPELKEKEVEIALESKSPKVIWRLLDQDKMGSTERGEHTALSFERFLKTADPETVLRVMTYTEDKKIYCRGFTRSDVNKMARAILQMDNWQAFLSENDPRVSFECLCYLLENSQYLSSEEAKQVNEFFQFYFQDEQRIAFIFTLGDSTLLRDLTEYVLKKTDKETVEQVFTALLTAHPELGLERFPVEAATGGRSTGFGELWLDWVLEQKNWPLLQSILDYAKQQGIKLPERYNEQIDKAKLVSQNGMTVYNGQLELSVMSDALLRGAPNEVIESLIAQGIPFDINAARSLTRLSADDPNCISCVSRLYANDGIYKIVPVEEYPVLAMFEKEYSLLKIRQNRLEVEQIKYPLDKDVIPEMIEGGYSIFADPDFNLSAFGYEPFRNNLGNYVFYKRDYGVDLTYSTAWSDLGPFRQMPATEFFENDSQRVNGFLESAYGLSQGIMYAVANGEPLPQVKGTSGIKVRIEQCLPELLGYVRADQSEPLPEDVYKRSSKLKSELAGMEIMYGVMERAICQSPEWPNICAFMVEQCDEQLKNPNLSAEERRRISRERSDWKKEIIPDPSARDRSFRGSLQFMETVGRESPFVADICNDVQTIVGSYENVCLMHDRYEYASNAVNLYHEAVREGRTRPASEANTEDNRQKVSVSGVNARENFAAHFNFNGDVEDSLFAAIAAPSAPLALYMGVPYLVTKTPVIKLIPYVGHIVMAGTMILDYHTELSESMYKGAENFVDPEKEERRQYHLDFFQERTKILKEQTQFYQKAANIPDVSIEELCLWAEQHPELLSFYEGEKYAGNQQVMLNAALEIMRSPEPIAENRLYKSLPETPEEGDAFLLRYGGDQEFMDAYIAMRREVNNEAYARQRAIICEQVYHAYIRANGYEAVADLKPKPAEVQPKQITAQSAYEHAAKMGYAALSPEEEQVLDDRAKKELEALENARRIRTQRAYTIPAFPTPTKFGDYSSQVPPQTVNLNATYEMPTPQPFVTNPMDSTALLEGAPPPWGTPNKLPGPEAMEYLPNLSAVEAADLMSREPGPTIEDYKLRIYIHEGKPYSLDDSIIITWPAEVFGITNEFYVSRKDNPDKRVPISMPSGVQSYYGALVPAREWNGSKIVPNLYYLQLRDDAFDVELSMDRTPPLSGLAKLERDVESTIKRVDRFTDNWLIDNVEKPVVEGTIGMVDTLLQGAKAAGDSDWGQQNLLALYSHGNMWLSGPQSWFGFDQAAEESEKQSLLAQEMVASGAFLKYIHAEGNDGPTYDVRGVLRQVSDATKEQLEDLGTDKGQSSQPSRLGHDQAIDLPDTQSLLAQKMSAKNKILKLQDEGNGRYNFSGLVRRFGEVKGQLKALGASEGYILQYVRTCNWWEFNPIDFVNYSPMLSRLNQVQQSIQKLEQPPKVSDTSSSDKMTPRQVTDAYVARIDNDVQEMKNETAYIVENADAQPETSSDQLYYQGIKYHSEEEIYRGFQLYFQDEGMGVRDSWTSIQKISSPEISRKEPPLVQSFISDAYALDHMTSQILMPMPFYSTFETTTNASVDAKSFKDMVSYGAILSGPVPAGLLYGANKMLGEDDSADQGCKNFQFVLPNRREDQFVPPIVRQQEAVSYLAAQEDMVYRFGRNFWIRERTGQEGEESWFSEVTKCVYNPNAFGVRTLHIDVKDPRNAAILRQLMYKNPRNTYIYHRNMAINNAHQAQEAYTMTALHLGPLLMTDDYLVDHRPGEFFRENKPELTPAGREVVWLSIKDRPDAEQLAEAIFGGQARAFGQVFSVIRESELWSKACEAKFGKSDLTDEELAKLVKIEPSGNKWLDAANRNAAMVDFCIGVMNEYKKGFEQEHVVAVDKFVTTPEYQTRSAADRLADWERIKDTPDAEETAQTVFGTEARKYSGILHEIRQSDEWKRVCQEKFGKPDLTDEEFDRLVTVDPSGNKWLDDANRNAAMIDFCIGTMTEYRDSVARTCVTTLKDYAESISESVEDAALHHEARFLTRGVSVVYKEIMNGKESVKYISKQQFMQIIDNIPLAAENGDPIFGEDPQKNQAAYKLTKAYLRGKPLSVFLTVDFVNNSESVKIFREMLDTFTPEQIRSLCKSEMEIVFLAQKGLLSKDKICEMIETCSLKDHAQWYGVLSQGDNYLYLADKLNEGKFETAEEKALALQKLVQMVKYMPDQDKVLKELLMRFVNAPELQQALVEECVKSGIDLRYLKLNELFYADMTTAERAVAVRKLYGSDYNVLVADLLNLLVECRNSGVNQEYAVRLLCQVFEKNPKNAMILINILKENKGLTEDERADLITAVIREFEIEEPEKVLGETMGWQVEAREEPVSTAPAQEKTTQTDAESFETDASGTEARAPETSETVAQSDELSTNDGSDEISDVRSVTDDKAVNSDDARSDSPLEETAVTEGEALVLAEKPVDPQLMENDPALFEKELDRLVQACAQPEVLEKVGNNPQVIYTLCAYWDKLLSEGKEIPAEQMALVREICKQHPDYTQGIHDYLETTTHAQQIQDLLVLAPQSEPHCLETLSGAQQKQGSIISRNSTAVPVCVPEEENLTLTNSTRSIS